MLDPAGNNTRFASDHRVLLFKLFVGNMLSQESSVRPGFSAVRPSAVLPASPRSILLCVWRKSASFFVGCRAQVRPTQM